MSGSCRLWNGWKGRGDRPSSLRRKSTGASMPDMRNALHTRGQPLGLLDSSGRGIQQLKSLAVSALIASSKRFSRTPLSQKKPSSGCGAP